MVTRRGVVHALLLAIALMLASTAPSMAATVRRHTTTTTTPRATTTTRAKTWPALRTFDTTLVWSPCHDSWECATLTVPVDWVHAPTTDTNADTVPLALVRHRATQPDARIGALVVNPGGPGEGGADYIPLVTRRFPDELLARFDIVSWDPRGTGNSRPIDCVDDATLDSLTSGPAVATTAETLGAAHEKAAELARGCGERMGTYVGQVGTRNTARATSRRSASRSANRPSPTSATRTAPCSG